MMALIQYFINKGFERDKDFKHEDIILSYTFKRENQLVVLDTEDIFSTEFSYKRFCQKQNEWMTTFEQVFRLIVEDYTSFDSLEDDFSEDYLNKQTMNRTDLSIDPSPLEYAFERCFEDAYGTSAFSYLQREYSLMLIDGTIGYLDYVLFKKDGRMIVIEENGLSYHHPYLIKKERYRKILLKQNSVVKENGVVFRWDTESMSNYERAVDEIRECIGDILDYSIQNYIVEKRSFVLHEHQKDYLQQIEADREKKVKASLVVLPVGTGKTTIAVEDAKQYLKLRPDARFLVIVPTRDLKLQWDAIFKDEDIGSLNFDVLTYQKVSRQYRLDAPEYYQYIIVDEAHHCVAPTLKRVINHYKPDFLLGLTATDKRMDNQKLEDVFGQYNSQLSLQEAIQKDVLCPIKAYRLETNIDLSKVRFNGKDYVNAQLERQIQIPSRDEAIAAVLKEYFMDKLPNKSGIVFCVSINHAKQMASVLKEKGFRAEAVDGQDKQRFKKIVKYMNREIQFLCTCSLLTEGWDAPHTSVIVMARPTLSKVLYMQQIGRGTRNAPGKESLYVIDVVDEYGGLGQVSNRPWSLHALFNQLEYTKFGDMVAVNNKNREMVLLDTVHEIPIKLDPIEIFTYEKVYGKHLSAEQLARELFVSTGTVLSWMRKGDIRSDVSISIGNTQLHLFAPEQVLEIRLLKGLQSHTEETIVNDFWSFIDTGDYTFSYKIYFILALLQTVDDTGDVAIDKLAKAYQNFYIKRHQDGLTIDRPASPYLKLAYVEDNKLMKKSMLSNPFEKFERKRFFYHSTDLAKISIHHRIWEELIEKGGKERLEVKMQEDLMSYYDKL